MGSRALEIRVGVAPFCIFVDEIAVLGELSH